MVKPNYITFDEKAYARAYYQKHKEKLKNQAKAYRDANRDDINKKQIEAYYLNKDKIKEKCQKIADAGFCRSHTNTKAVIKGWCNLCALKNRLRRQVRHLVKQGKVYKNNKTTEILGCSFEQFKNHIESQFLSGMAWDNISEWHIDHIKPLASAKTSEDLLNLFHYSNLRPLWAIENIKKGSWYMDILYKKDGS